MSLIINTIYAVLTWTSVFAIGFSGPWAILCWFLVVMAALQTLGLIAEAVK